MKYKDVFIDLLGYRKYGVTRAMNMVITKLLNQIANHPSVKEIYAQKLISENVIADSELKKMEVNTLMNWLDMADSKKEKMQSATLHGT